MSDVEQALTALGSDFPDWHIWRSNEGHCYATRWQAVSEEVSETYGCVRTVHAPSPAELRAELHAQTAAAERAIAELGTLR